MSHLVFVYGSLKKGFHNYGIMFAHGEPDDMGDAVTVQPYLMLSAGPFPYLVDPEALSADHEACVSDVIGKVQGELYEVDDATLADLDRLESHPDFYRREQVAVQPEDHPDAVNAWVYFLQNPIDAIQHCPVVALDERGDVEWKESDVVAFAGPADDAELSEEG